MNAPARRIAVEDLLAAQFARRLREDGCTKRSAVRLAIVDAIHAGDLRPGDDLPSERRLVDVFGVSLGTVQAALQQLQRVGRIVRRRGDGSRVTERDVPWSDDVWHFRIVDRDSRRPLRWERAEVRVDRVSGDAPQSAAAAGFLGADQAFVRVRRRIAMEDGVAVGADMHLPDAHAKRLLTINPAELSLVNLRPYLAESFGLVAARATHSVAARVLTDMEAAAYGLEAAGLAFVIDAQLWDPDDAPLYHQTVYAPCDCCALAF